MKKRSEPRVAAYYVFQALDYISKALAPNLWALKEREENTKMVTPFRNMARSVTSLAARWPVHSLAHELAASPEATSRLLSSAERCLARSDEGGKLS